VARLTKSALGLQEGDRGTAALDAAAQDARNAALVALERAFLREEGLPGRPWFKHQV
jgi:hypothetical protein